MEPTEYELMYRVEDSHWWYQGMAAITRAVIESCYARGGSLRILDAGCGTGGAMSWLSDYGKVTGLELSSHALHYCKMRGHSRVLLASVTAIPFSSETFDLVVSLDVLYFMNVQDELALQEFLRILVPEGRALLRLPAYNWLRGAHDRKVSTGHRYTSGELREKMLRIGLNPEFLTYANTLLFPMILLKRLGDRFLPAQSSSDVAIDVKSLSRFLKACLLLESRLIRRRSLPFGLSLVGLAKKPSR